MNRDPMKVQHNHHKNDTTGHDEEQFSCSRCDKKFTIRDRDFEFLTSSALIEGA